MHVNDQLTLSGELHGATIEEAQHIAARYRARCIDAERDRDQLRAALTEILNLGQETCATHEDQCIAATQIAQRALVTPNDHS